MENASLHRQATAMSARETSTAQTDQNRCRVARLLPPPHPGTDANPQGEYLAPPPPAQDPSRPGTPITVPLRSPSRPRDSSSSATLPPPARRRAESTRRANQLITGSARGDVHICVCRLGHSGSACAHTRGTRAYARGMSSELAQLAHSGLACS